MSRLAGAFPWALSDDGKCIRSRLRAVAFCGGASGHAWELGFTGKQEALASADLGPASELATSGREGGASWRRQDSPCEGVAVSGDLVQALKAVARGGIYDADLAIIETATSADAARADRLALAAKLMKCARDVLATHGFMMIATDGDMAAELRVLAEEVFYENNLIGQDLVRRPCAP